VLESREVMALGALRPIGVDLRVCSATHRSLREQVAAGRLREDLYFRIGRPEVAIPPLRERLEEIPWLISREIERLLRERGQEPLVVHASFVEACLLRPWPGNVREILTEARAALQHAVAAHATRVEASHLAATAGLAFSLPPAPAAAEPVEPAREVRAKRRHFVPPDRAQIEQALQRAEGNVTRAARELGVHRNQLRRLIDEHQLDPGQFAPSGRTPP